MSDEMSLEDFQLNDGAPPDFNPITYIINDESQATWAMRKLAVAQRRINEVREQALKEHDRIDRWEQHATKSDVSTVDYFTEALSNYIKRVRQEKGIKTLPLPDGTVKSRETHDTFKVEDVGVFVKWAEDSGHPEWIRTKREPDVQAMKSEVFYSGGMVVAPDGETIDGLVHVPGSISVTVEVSE